MIDLLKLLLCLFEDIVAKREKSNHFLIFDGASITCMRSVKCMTSNKKHIQVQNRASNSLLILACFDLTQYDF